MQKQDERKTVDDLQRIADPPLMLISTPTIGLMSATLDQGRLWFKGGEPETVEFAEVSDPVWCWIDEAKELEPVVPKPNKYSPKACRAAGKR